MNKECEYKAELMVIREEFKQLQAEREQLKKSLDKYGQHLRNCELEKQPRLTSTDSHWKCTCGYSKARNCQMCNGIGYVVDEKIAAGFYTGHCPECGMKP